MRIRTDGDRLTGSLASLGGTGVFVTALRDALLDGRCDVAVHSLKDLPTGDDRGSCSGPCRSARTRATRCAPATG